MKKQRKRRRSGGNYDDPLMDHKLFIRVTDAMYQTIRMKAERSGMNVSDYVREHLKAI